jgi:hypothetical protein
MENFIFHFPHIVEMKIFQLPKKRSEATSNTMHSLNFNRMKNFCGAPQNLYFISPSLLGLAVWRNEKGK